MTKKKMSANELCRIISRGKNLIMNGKDESYEVESAEIINDEMLLIARAGTTTKTIIVLADIKEINDHDDVITITMTDKTTYTIDRSVSTVQWLLDELAIGTSFDVKMQTGVKDTDGYEITLRSEYKSY